MKDSLCRPQNNLKGSVTDWTANPIHVLAHWLTRKELPDHAGKSEGLSPGIKNLLTSGPWLIHVFFKGKKCITDDDTGTPVATVPEFHLIYQFQAASNTFPDKKMSCQIVFHI